MSFLAQQARRIFANWQPADMRKGFTGLESLSLGALGEDRLRNGPAG